MGWCLRDTTCQLQNISNHLHFFGKGTVPVRYPLHSTCTGSFRREWINKSQTIIAEILCNLLEWFSSFWVFEISCTEAPRRIDDFSAAHGNSPCPQFPSPSFFFLAPPILLRSHIIFFQNLKILKIRNKKTGIFKLKKSSMARRKGRTEESIEPSKQPSKDIVGTPPSRASMSVSKTSWKSWNFT